MLAIVWMDCGAFLMGGGAIETLPKVAVSASIVLVSSPFSWLAVVVGDEVDVVSFVAVLSLLACESLSLSSVWAVREEQLLLSLPACGDDDDPIAFLKKN